MSAEMPTPLAGVRFAGSADLDQVVGLLTEAFLISPVGDWLVPDLPTRREIYRGYLAIHAAHVMKVGFADVTVDGSGVALWLPRLQRMPPPDDYDEQLADVCGPWLRRFQLLDALLAEHHPRTPHHYLALLGVDPRAQRRGVGGALLNHHHANLDDAGVPAYLEASTVGSRDLYLRHGYTLAATAPVELPEGGPLLWPMWREPRPTQPTTSGNDQP
jgi:GNAT superfamily N-acetyltransferase